MGFADKVLGPKVPKELYEQHRSRYQVSTWCFVGAALLLIVSTFLPYWTLDLKAPQYPEGLQVKAYVNRLVGDVGELEEVNHYVGMRSLRDGAAFERSISVIGIVVLAGLVLAGVFVHTRWVVLLVLPALLFPLVFLGDLQWWLYNYGHTLDPSAAFSASIKSFTPRVLGHGVIAQFATDAWPAIGLILAMLASVLVIVGLVFHRRAYKPLVEAAALGAKAGSEATPEATPQAAPEAVDTPELVDPPEGATPAP
ncbi:MAG: cytochrome C [Acidimicrobiia bacterium]